MKRTLEPELLDHLPADDPRAIHSRRDLRRINALMGNARAISSFLKSARLEKPPWTLVELGAGDGHIAVQAAGMLPGRGRIILVDQAALTPASAPPGWDISAEKADVFEWIANAPPADIIIANLFLHHFDEARLQKLFAACAPHCRCFAAAEPRRNRASEWFARRLGWIGCNEVTRHDGVISVRAGFHGTELSALWPAGGWSVRERRAGLFTHFFGARRG